jgi:hypothetical protein
MNKAVAVTGAAVIVAAIVVGGAYALHKTESSFSLQRDREGVCRPSEPSHMIAGWKNKVRWVVLNIDCPPQYVSLRNFRHPLTGGGYDPAETIFETAQVDGGPISPGSTGHLDAKVEKLVLLPRLFKYDVWLGENSGSMENRRDPDIELWPF